MIVKRFGAIALAALLILGAWLIRDRVIDDDTAGGGDDGPGPARREIVCVSDLADVCRALGDDRRDLEVLVEPAGATLDALAALDEPADAPIWITMSPFPAIVDDLRAAGRKPPIAGEQVTVASSPIVLVAPVDRAAALAKHCGVPLDWRCVGDTAGERWEDIDAGGLPGTVKPGFSPIDSAIGLLGVADAVAGYFGDAPIMVDDFDFLRWAEPLATTVPATSLSARTAIATLETRPSALDIAVGAVAELTGTSGSRFQLEYADPMVRADVVVAVPEGATAPDALADTVGQLLIDAGWEPPSVEANPLPSATDLLAIRVAWTELVS